MARSRKVKSEITPQEQLLVDRYPDVKIVPSSWRASGGREECGHKASVLISCIVCGKEAIRCTSDLWQSGKWCPTCSRDVRAGRKATKAAKKGAK